MTQNYLLKDTADYPKTSAAQAVMIEIAQKYEDKYDSALKECSKDNKMQKKVLSIQKHMAGHCGTFAGMANTRNTYEGIISFRENILKRQNILQEYESKLTDLSPDERGAFILYAYTNWFLHNTFIDRHIAQLNAAIASGQSEKAFDDRIILGTVYSICREWRAWWLENGTAAFDKWTYEDSPWEVEE